MLLSVLLLLIALVLFYELYWKRRNLPPGYSTQANAHALQGPMPLPLIGNIASIAFNKPYMATEKWKKQFGPIFTQWLAVVIADYELMKETVIREGDKYADRFTNSTVAEFRGGIYGVIDTSGDDWREMRRFTLHTLRDFGMGKSLMEHKILCEAGAVSERLAKNGRDVAPQWEFDLAVGSIINNVLFGYRFDETNESEFREIKAILNRHFKQVSSLAALAGIMASATRVLPPVRGAMQQLHRNRDALFGFLRSQALTLKNTIDYDSQDSDTLVEAFFKEQRRRQHEPEFGGYHMTQLENVLMDLWTAGMETTSNTLTWSIAYVLRSPHVQRKIHEELRQKIGASRQIVMADKPALNYLNATINETQRLANILPSNLFRKTTETVVIRGYTIPKGSMVIPQISAVLYDDKIFPDPFAFKPERFLQDDGSLRKIEEFVPFSVGRRQCPGESLARMELFLFLANIFNQFEVTADELPSIEKTPAFTMCPQPYTCHFTRKSY